MSVKRLLVSSILALISMGAAHAESFDLLCSGNMTRWINEEAMPSEDFSERFRLDISAENWCRGNCESVLKILKLDENEIIFLNGTPLDLGGGDIMITNLSINRRTSHFIEISRVQLFGKTMRILKAGSCTKEPFSGYPSQRF